MILLPDNARVGDFTAAAILLPDNGRVGDFTAAASFAAFILFSFLRARLSSSIAVSSFLSLAFSTWNDMFLVIFIETGVLELLQMFSSNTE
jgi:hypothetical protein